MKLREQCLVFDPVYMDGDLEKIEKIANDVLTMTATMHEEVKRAMEQLEKESVGMQQLEHWMQLTLRANKSVSLLARIAQSSENRRIVETAILNETVKRDMLDREASFAHTWYRLRRQATANGQDTSATVDRAIASVHQVESALDALAPIPFTHYHGAPALQRLYEHEKDEVPMSVT